MSFYIWKDIDAIDYVSKLRTKYPSYAGKSLTDLLKQWDFYKLPGGSSAYFHDYLQPPVSGYEVLVVPQTPSIPNPQVVPEIPNGSYIANNAQPAIKFTEIGSEVAVTGGGVMSAVSSATATAAVGAAIGFGVGVNWFETYPEEWTQISNVVFGTNLDPAEIGQMARDTNALVMIKDGVSYMCAPVIDAIREKLNELGFYDEKEHYPDIPAEANNLNVSSFQTNFTSAEELQKILFNADFSDETMAQAIKDVINFGEYVEIESSVTTPLSSERYGTVQVTSSKINTPPLPKTVTVYKQTPSAGEIIEDNYWRSTGSEFNITTRSCGFHLLPNENRITWLFEPGEPSTFNSSIAVGKREYLSVNKDVLFTNKANTNASKSSRYPLYLPSGNMGDLNLTVKDAFPAWWNTGVDVISGVDGNGDPIYTRWLPVSLPSNKPLTDGIPYDQTKAQEGALPDDDTQVAEQVKTGTKDLTNTYPQVSTPTIPPTSNPTPPSPPIIGGGGSATGLANLYNPTLAQVKQFSRWLWGSDGLNLDQLKKLLQDPMQAIIGLHVMYATPTTGADRDIQVGYINSGVTSKIVTEQYTEIDCGTVTINEYFGDARDYSPFTQVYCYLPFIGIVELNADDVVNSILGIKYKIDVLTGCCLAQLTVKKYGLDAVLYTYTGNCAVQMPITSGNYLSTVSSLLGAVVSGAAAVATGGALAPVAIGAAANAMGGGARASVAMSGSLGSNAGAMGIRKPYLIIKRVESADANGYNEFYGYPTNKRVNLSQLTGYVRVKDINLSGTNATEDEQNEIVTLLKEGVIL